MQKQYITIPIFIPHQGCANRCIFCNQWTVSNTQKLPDLSSIDTVIEQYLSTAPDHAHVELAFFGGSFTGLPLEKQKMLLSHIQKYIKTRHISSIRLSTRPDYINSEILSLLKKHNVKTIELGVQSFNDRVLTASQRGHNSDDVFNAINLIKNSKFDFVIQLMPGLPCDSAELSLENARIAAGLSPAAVRIYPAVVLKNTELANQFKQQLYTPLTLEEAVEITRGMFQIFKQKHIPVIRMGLHPMDPQNLSSVIAGPYHPSFGFLVKSRMARDILEKEVSAYLKALHNPVKKLVIHIPREKKEEYIGNARDNISYIKDMFKLQEIQYHISQDNTLSLDHSA